MTILAHVSRKAGGRLIAPLPLVLGRRLLANVIGIPLLFATAHAQERTAIILEDLAAIANAIQQTGTITAADKALLSDFEELQNRYRAAPKDRGAREQFALAAARLHVRDSERVDQLIDHFELFIPLLRETANLIPGTDGRASQEYRNVLAGVSGNLRRLPSGPVRDRLLKIVAERYRGLGVGIDSSPASSVERTLENSEAIYTELIWTRVTLEKSRLDLHGQVIQLIVDDFGLDGFAERINVDLLGEDRQRATEVELTPADWSALNELQNEFKATNHRP